MDSDIVIGLEVHVQLNTATKLFCGCPTKPSEKMRFKIGDLPPVDVTHARIKEKGETVTEWPVPNTFICPTCLGHPGSKPVLNAKALEFGTKLALALGCSIAPTVVFSRKTYFYPDLVKNFQITQYEVPLGSDGQLVVSTSRLGITELSIVLGNQDKVVRIQRVHIEEDPGALIHESSGCLIDYNRSGIPLCEIVTAPDMSSPIEAREFMKKLMKILGYLDIFDENTCTIKADANISIKEKHYTRVEIKNITGFKEIERALNYEVQRQKQQEVKRETRGWDADKGITYHMRSKEQEEDYGYIVEPDLPLFEISPEWIRKIQTTIPELGEQRALRWVNDWRIDKSDAQVIAADLDVAILFERIAAKIDPVLASHWVRREVLRLMNDKKKELRETAFDAEGLTELLQLFADKKINNRVAQRLIEQLAEKKFSPAAYVKEQGLTMVADEGALESICKDVISKNQKAVEDYKKGEQKSIMFLVGQVMKQTKGTASAQVIQELLKGLLK